jgi:hypothetical protein
MPVFKVAQTARSNGLSGCAFCGEVAITLTEKGATAASSHFLQLLANKKIKNRKYRIVFPRKEKRFFIRTDLGLFSVAKIDGAL